METYTHQIHTPFGQVTVSSDGHALTGLWFDGQKYYGKTLGDHTIENRSLPLFTQVEAWLNDYFSGQQPTLDFKVKPAGTEFRKTVWNELLSIPYGNLITYGEIAQRFYKTQGKNMSAQAVGGAVGHNPISIIIPCHRVVGSNGSLTGYAGGIGVKKKLLQLEDIDLTHLHEPTKGTAL
ncbi:methylated-DNA--[protein]-cysteine S-methyltransferase [Geomicrobium sediminis]|uniref:Methylated-DNA--protein-cysteine methyltransferase n=1 Tax=Geomicrobium sediminis TaxID=1347788 RepID=A0ABS2PCM2_9BACL|nr:methylated-DNA--[protein]-cysteine S-methyltransferase [Geomicrobium sediminis]MBM7633158.1 methylated-DNA-[protein]-cysteine S-methyltransferase [Geomicrobium sediminis]